MVWLWRLDVVGGGSDLGLMDSLVDRIDPGWDVSSALLMPAVLHVIVEDLTNKIAWHVGVDSGRHWWCHLLGVKGPLSWQLLCLWRCKVSEMTYVIKSQISEEAFDCFLGWLRLRVIRREGRDCSIWEIVLIWCPEGLVVELAWIVVLIDCAVRNVLISELFSIRVCRHSLVLGWLWSLAICRITVWNFFVGAWEVCRVGRKDSVLDQKSATLCTSVRCRGGHTSLLVSRWAFCLNKAGFLWIIGQFCRT